MKIKEFIMRMTDQRYELYLMRHITFDAPWSSGNNMGTGKTTA